MHIQDNSGIVNIGIGTSWPVSALGIVGNVGIGTAGGNYVINTAPVNGMIVEGNVGVGTWAPRSSLQVVGGDVRVGTGTFVNTSAADDLYVTGNLEVGGTIYGSGAGISGLSAGGWTDGGTNVQLAARTDNVGIGTEFPSGKLEIVQTAAQAALMISSIPSGDGDLVIVTSNGNVGLGSVAPVGRLQVNGDAVINGTGSTNLTIGVSSIGSVNGVDLRMGTGGDLRMGAFDSSNTFGGAAFQLFSNSNPTYPGQLYFDAGNDALSALIYRTGQGGVVTERMRIDSGGNVGIGTAIPMATLTVKKTGARPLLQVTNSGDGDFLVVTSTGNIGIGTTVPADLVNVNNGSVLVSGNGELGLNIYTADNSAFLNPLIYTHRARGTVTSPTVVSDGDTLFEIYPTAYDGAAYQNSVALTAEVDGSATAGRWVFYTGGAGIAMTLKNSGNLGLGTTTPGSNLAVIGGASFGNAYATVAAPLGGVIVAANVGVGTWAPRSSLQVVGGDLRVGTGTFVNTSAADDLYVTGNLEVGGTIYGSGAGISGLSAGGWTDGGTNIQLATRTDNVGIGTEFPSGKVEIVQTAAQAAFMISSVASGDGDFMIVTSNGNVGFGTTVPEFAVTLRRDVNADVGFAAVNTNAGASAFANNKFTNDVGQNAWVGTGSNASSIAWAGRAYLDSSSGNGVTLAAEAATGDIRFYIGGGLQANEKMRIEPHGWVGIGTANPICPDGGNCVELRAASSRAQIFADSASGQPTDIFLGDGGTTQWSISHRGEADSRFSLWGKNAGTFNENLTVLQNGNVGIGTWTPASKLTVLGNVGIGTVGGNYVSTTAPANGLIVEGNVGVGTWAPRASLQVKGGDVRVGTGTFNNTSAADDLYVTGNLEVDGTLYGDGSGLTNVSGTNAGWTDAGTNVYVITLTDNVGIGTVNPNGAHLEIVKQNAQPQLKISSTASAGGDYLIVTSTGNVGIGTVAPTQLMQVAGSAQINTALYVGTGTGTFYGDDNLIRPTASSAFLNIKGGSGRAKISLGNDAIRIISGNSEEYIDLRYNATTSTDSGSSALLIDGNGNIGIGTTGPAAQVDLVKAGTNPLFRISSTVTSSGDFLIVTSVGNVGVGTVVPADRLNVNNNLTFTAEFNNGNSGAAATVDWHNGNKQALTLTGACTLTFTAPGGVTNLLLRLVQDATGSRTVTWPAAVKWPGGVAPTLSTAANAVDIVTCYYNNSNYYCSDSLDFK